MKRIRPAVLGPFDYTQLPRTGGLWWFEGVTDYYTTHLMHRSGWFGEPRYYAAILSNVEEVRGNPNRLVVSPYDSSYKVRDTANGRGNSNGYLVSYYNEGWVLGMLLDIELRSRTHNQHSLDDVEHALWNLCRNDRPGIAEDEIRKQLVRFGGDGMGPIYDKWVMQPGELPIEQELRAVGLELQDKEVPINTPGFAWQASRQFGGIRVLKSAGGLEASDVVVGANGVDLSALPVRQMTSMFQQILDSLKPGDRLNLKGRRGAVTLDVVARVEAGVRHNRSVVERTDATPAERLLREQWMFGARGRPKTVKEP